MQAADAGALPEEYAEQLLPWARAVVQLSQTLAAAQEDAVRGEKNAERATALTKLHAFVEHERLKV